MKNLTPRIVENQGKRFIQFDEMIKLGLAHVMTTVDQDLTKSRPRQALARDYELALGLLGAGLEDLHRLDQIHSDIIVKAGGGTALDDLPVGDGLFGQTAGQVLAISIADCVPLILYNPGAKKVFALHSGWKGTLLKIGEKALEGENPRNFQVFIGPHIGKEDFEVGPELVEPFSQAFRHYLDPADFIRQKDAGHWLVDLSACMVAMFEGLGVQDIYLSQDSTYARPDLYHSYRRDGADRYGSMNFLVKVP